MKRKFSLLINLATLVLCISAIAIGVYSAKQASLNVSGTVGFTAHDCKVEVTGTIKGHATGPDDAPITTPQDITSVTVKDTKTLDLGTIYFSDMTSSGEINPITLTLNFENLSDFDVEVKLTTLTIDGITITPDKTSVILSNKSAAEADKKNNIVVTLTCSSASTGITPEEKQILQVNMAKYAFIVQSGATNESTRNYVTMGTYIQDSTTKDIRWYIFARGDGSTMNAVNANIVENDSALPAGTYWFISEYVLGSSVFNDKYSTYEGSIIQKYLTGTEKGSFIDTYGIDSSNPVYSKITGRTINMRGKGGRKVAVIGYKIAQKIFGFN